MEENFRSPMFINVNPTPLQTRYQCSSANQNPHEAVTEDHFVSSIDIIYLEDCPPSLQKVTTTMTAHPKCAKLLGGPHSHNSLLLVNFSLPHTHTDAHTHKPLSRPNIALLRGTVWVIFTRNSPFAFKTHGTVWSL